MTEFSGRVTLKNAVFLVVGDQIRMMCDYDGVPRPSVEWTMDNTELPSDAVSQSDGRVLFIADAAVSFI